MFTEFLSSFMKILSEVACLLYAASIEYTCKYKIVVGLNHFRFPMV